MSDYYYFEDKEAKDGDFNVTPVLGEDYISALFSIARKHKVNITDELILAEIYQKKKLSKITNTYLYVDGTNLFAGQNELFGPLRYLSFQYLIEEINKLVKIDKVCFYASYMNNKQRLDIRRKELITAEALFYREVIKTSNTQFYKGHRSTTSGKEKGVDVHLAVDIVKDAFLGRCDRVVLMTGDADLIYPLEIVRTLNIPTYAIFLPNRFSLEMAYKAKNSFVLNFLSKFKINRKSPKHLKIVSIKKPRMINIRGK